MSTALTFEILGQQKVSFYDCVPFRRGEGGLRGDWYVLRRDHHLVRSLFVVAGMDNCLSYELGLWGGMTMLLKTFTEPLAVDNRRT